jgi:hypothetical protein
MQNKLSFGGPKKDLFNQLDYLAKPDLVGIADDYLLVRDCIFEKDLPDKVKIPEFLFEKTKVGEKRESDK